MKTLLKAKKELIKAGRWDIDFHLPAVGITRFPKELWKRIDSVADIVKDKRDPTRSPEELFQYIDISSVDVEVGMIQSPQEITGEEAPSRARKVVRAFDLVISTCRPTRGAIAVVPQNLHDQIASTGFSIIRPHQGVNPYYLHYAIRLASTLEQFRKWSTGSSYPAILDEDVAKTIIPVPDTKIQDEIAARILRALREREKSIRAANEVWGSTLAEITSSIGGKATSSPTAPAGAEKSLSVLTADEVAKALAKLPPLSLGNAEKKQKELAI